MNPTTLLHRAALPLGLAALTLVPGAAQATQTVQKSVPATLFVSGSQNTEWHMKDEFQDGCTGGTIVYEHTGDEDLAFRTPEKVAATLSTVHDDADDSTFTRIDLAPPDPRGAFLGLDASTRRSSTTTQTQVGGHESGCGGSDEDPEPPLGPDCGTKQHKLWVRLTLDASGNLKVSNSDILNTSPFQRCSTPAKLTSPRLAEVQDDTTTTVTGQGASRVATIVGHRIVHQPLPGGEAVTSLRWRSVLALTDPGSDDEELAAAGESPAALPAIAPATAPAPRTAPALVPARRYSRIRWGRQARKQAHKTRRPARHRR
jgi:hypothetical protein